MFDNLIPTNKIDAGQITNRSISGYPFQEDLMVNRDIQPQYYFSCVQKSPLSDKGFNFPIHTRNDSYKNDIKDEKEMIFYPPDEIHKHIRKRKLTSKDIKKAMSIIGIVKQGLEEDLSDSFREYLYKK